MPSPFAHTAAGYLIFRYYKQNLPRCRIQLLRIPIQLIIIASLSLLPDIDVLPGLVMDDIGRFHNNASHSLIVGLFVALIISVSSSRVYKSPPKVWFIASLISYDLHIIMDFFAGERGVMLFWPLTSARFGSPIKLFVGVQWGYGLVSISHLWTIFTEAFLFLLVLIILRLLHRYISTASAPYNPEMDQ